MYVCSNLDNTQHHFLHSEYYFSEENLVKDFFLRRKMNVQGYLPLTLIASFQRIQNLTVDIDLVIEAVLESDRLELLELEDGYKVS